MIELWTQELKRGGIDDSDENDALMFYNLSDALTSLLSSSNLISVIDSDSNYKGYWYIRISVNSEIKNNRLSQQDKINKAFEKVQKYKQELIDFNLKIANKIKNQSSKKKTCSHCNSNISVSFIKTHKCPVCSTPMYSNTELKRFNNILARIKKSEATLNSIKD